MAFPQHNSLKKKKKVEVARCGKLKLNVVDQDNQTNLMHVSSLKKLAFTFHHMAPNLICLQLGIVHKWLSISLHAGMPLLRFQLVPRRI